MSTGSDRSGAARISPWRSLARRNASKLVAACAAALSIVAGVASLVLMRDDASSSTSGAEIVASVTPSPPSPYVDGFIVRIDGRHVRLRMRDTTGDFVIARELSPRLDLKHLRTHARDGMPTRVYYRRPGTTPEAVDIEDAPINF